GGATASFTVNSDTQVTATVPQAAETGPISITTPIGDCTSTQDFVVTSPPKLNGVCIAQTFFDLCGESTEVVQCPPGAAPISPAYEFICIEFEPHVDRARPCFVSNRFAREGFCEVTP